MLFNHHIPLSLEHKAFNASSLQSIEDLISNLPFSLSIRIDPNTPNLRTMKLDIDFELALSTAWNSPTAMDDLLTKVAVQHNAYAFHQCPNCLATSTEPGPTFATEVVPHPSRCIDCKNLAADELTEVRLQQKEIRYDLGLLDEYIMAIPNGVEKAMVEKLSGLCERENVLKVQVARPCTYSIPLKPSMKSDGKYASMQVERIDPRYVWHNHQGRTMRFGGEVGTEGWKKADEALSALSKGSNLEGKKSYSWPMFSG